MSAASPKAETARDASGHEPSMEEILASIRRIIADDQAGEAEAAPAPVPRQAPPVAPVPAPHAGNDDVLDLAEVARPLRRPPPAAFAPPALDLDDALDFAEPPSRPAPRPAPQAAPQRVQAAVEEQVVERLVSKATDDSVGQAFGLLAHTVLTSNTRTLEDLVKEMLRPMLKAWLDDNLPVMVERLVRIEIERVARGR